MATVTGLTAERMLAIEASSIVDGTIDVDGHLQLTTHGGDTIDAGYALVAIPDASTSTRGSVELATEAETTAHTDTVRAVTPASLAATIARIAGLEAEPGERVQVVTAGAESAGLSTYPIGVSIMTIGGGSGWSVNSGVASILTVNVENTNRGFQIAYSTNGGTVNNGVVYTWSRTYHSPEGWTAWTKAANSADPATMGFVGEIRMWGGASAPSGWMLCEGGAINRTTFAALFAILGTSYGAGNGTTTFNVPDFRGRMPVGLDSGQAEFDTRGDTGGAKTHTLLTSEMPTHTHVQNGHTHTMGGTGALTDGGTGNTTYNVAGGGTFGFRTNNTGSTTPTNQDTGGGGAHNNLPPFLVVKYIIKTS